MVSLKSLKCTGRNFSSCAKQGFWTSSRASLSCGSLAKSPKLYLKNLAGLWIYRRNKSKVTGERERKSLWENVYLFLLLFKATKGVRKFCVKAKRGGRERAKWRHMQGKSEEEGNLCFRHQTDMLLLTIFHIFFMLACLVIILVVSSKAMQDLLGRQSWLYQGKLERSSVWSKFSWSTRNPGMLWRWWPGVTLEPEVMSTEKMLV